MQKTQKLPKLTKKQKGFVKDYLDTGNGTESAARNYDVKSRKVANVIAAENLAKPSITAYLEDKASDAASTIYDLSQNAEMEPVRLNASKDILDRAGYKPIEKSQSVNITVNISPEERARLELVAHEALKKLDD